MNLAIRLEFKIPAKQCSGRLSIDTSIIHDTFAVIANEVKQSSGFLSGLPRRPCRLAMTGSSGLPRRLRLLMELLANRPSQQAGKSLVIAMTGIPEHASPSSNTETSIIADGL
jgi:hypothetical protein